VLLVLVHSDDSHAVAAGSLASVSVIPAVFTPPWSACQLIVTIALTLLRSLPMAFSDFYFA